MTVMILNTFAPGKMNKKTDKTCSELISLVLKRCGELSNEDIKWQIVRDYGVGYQNNTIAKYLSFLIKEGKVESRTVTDHAVYKWVYVEEKKSYLTISAVDMLKKCRERLLNYPHDHPQVEKIKEQCRILQKKAEKEQVTS